MSSITVSITPDAAVTVTVDGASVTTPVSQGTALTQGGLYRSATGRTWLYDPQGDSYEPWVRILDKKGRHDSSLIGKRYANTRDNVSFPLVALTEGAEVTSRRP
jgi:hypothetical protein